MKKTRFVSVFAILAVAILISVVFALVSGDDLEGDGVLLGVPLVRPAFAQTVDPFPDPDVGLSAYTKLNPGSLDLDLLVTGLFDDLDFVGDNYVVGHYLEARSGTGEYLTEVHLYADDDGWMVAYLRPDELAAEVIVQRTDLANGSVLTAAMTHAALVGGAIATGDQISDERVRYYDWRFPTSTQLVLARRDDVGNLYLSVPEGSTFYDVSVALRCNGVSIPAATWHPSGDDIYCPAAVFGALYKSVPLLDTLPDGKWTDNLGIVIGSAVPNPLSVPPQTGIVHTLHKRQVPAVSGFAGVAIVYGP